MFDSCHEIHVMEIYLIMDYTSDHINKQGPNALIGSMWLWAWVL